MGRLGVIHPILEYNNKKATEIGETVQRNSFHGK